MANDMKVTIVPADMPEEEKKRRMKEFINCLTTMGTGTETKATDK